MSYEHFKWAWEQDMDASKKIILVALANFADEENSCFPGHERLSRMSGLSLSTVGRKIRELEDMGAFTRERRVPRSGSGRTSDRYYLNMRFTSSRSSSQGGAENCNESERQDESSDDSQELNQSPRQDETRFNRSSEHVSIGHSDRGTEREQPEVLNSKSPESEPDGSDDAPVAVLLVDEDVERQELLLDVLDDAVEGNGFKRPARTKANQRAMRLMLTKDGYSEQQVRWMIYWATDHHFWYKNIRSAEKLRQQFDRLVVEAKESAGNGPKGGARNSAQDRQDQNMGVLEQLRAEAETDMGMIGR